MLLVSRGAANTAPRTDHSVGISIASIGVVALSFDAVLIRLAEVNVSTAAFWRACFIALALVVYLALRKRLSEFSVLGRYRWVAVLCCFIYGFNTSAFVFAVTYTGVSNTVVILCSTPFFSALFSWLMLGERLDRTTWFTIFVAVAGVFVVFFGASSSVSFLGNFLALTLAVSSGFLLTYLRRHPGLPRISAIASGALLSGLFMWPFMLAPDGYGAGFLWLILSGVFLKPLASVCMLTATRYIPSPEVSIFLLLETLLAPVWAWLLIDEAVTDATLAGGTVILFTVAAHSWWEIRKEKAVAVPSKA